MPRRCHRGETRGLEGEANMTVHHGGQAADVTLVGSYDTATERVDVGVTFAELVPAESSPSEPTPAPGDTKGKGSKRTKPRTDEPKTSTEPKTSATPDPFAKTEPKPKPKPEVFMDSKQGKDDGIFLPVGGK